MTRVWCRPEPCHYLHTTIYDNVAYHMVVSSQIHKEKILSWRRPTVDQVKKVGP